MIVQEDSLIYTGVAGAFNDFAEYYRGNLDQTHVALTGERIARAFAFAVSGLKEDPKKVLELAFVNGNYDEMVHVRSIRVVSTCAHHGKDILGKAHFAYIPEKKIVGLSKIARLVDILSRRLQVQENLTSEIVDTFMEVVAPAGCAVHIRAYHMCMIARGIQEPMAVTETTALRGNFKTQDIVRAEFLSSIDRSEVVFP